MSLISQEAATEHFTTSLGPLTPSSFLSLTENRSSQIGTFSTYSAVNFPQVHSPTVLPSLSVKAWGDLKPLQRRTIVDVLSCAISSVLLLLWWFLPFAFSLYTRWVLSAFIHIHVLPNLKKNNNNLGHILSAFNFSSWLNFLEITPQNLLSYLRTHFQYIVNYLCSHRSIKTHWIPGC